MFEEDLVEPILQNEIRTPCHLYSGEEGVAVGLCAALSRDDYIFGNHRSHGHFLAKACPPGGLFSVEFIGTEGSWSCKIKQ